MAWGGKIDHHGGSIPPGWSIFPPQDCRSFPPGWSICPPPGSGGTDRPSGGIDRPSGGQIDHPGGKDRPSGGQIDHPRGTDRSSWGDRLAILAPGMVDLSPRMVDLSPQDGRSFPPKTWGGQINHPGGTPRSPPRCTPDLPQILPRTRSFGFSLHCPSQNLKIELGISLAWMASAVLGAPPDFCPTKAGV